MTPETQVRLLSVKSAVPPHVITQREAAEVAHRSFSGRFADFDRLALLVPRIRAESATLKAAAPPGAPPRRPDARPSPAPIA